MPRWQAAAEAAAFNWLGPIEGERERARARKRERARERESPLARTSGIEALDLGKQVPRGPHDYHTCTVGYTCKIGYPRARRRLGAV